MTNSSQRFLEKNSDVLIKAFEQMMDKRRLELFQSAYNNKNKDDCYNTFTCSTVTMEELLKSMNELAQSSSSSTELPEPPTTQQQLKQLKSRLKYCKSHLERVNIEREINKLKKEEKNK